MMTDQEYADKIIILAETNIYELADYWHHLNLRMSETEMFKIFDIIGEVRMKNILTILGNELARSRADGDVNDRKESAKLLYEVESKFGINLNIPWRN
jgi:hypothetical protein